ncbi:MAG TPA: GTPase domain-containing protein [Tepidisphaeraceae bacterium]
MSRSTRDLVCPAERLRDALSAIAWPAAERVGNDLSAALHHLRRDAGARAVVVVLGGTGTGKSTIVNRLLGSEITATSFRRTFTAGPVAITPGPLPADFAALPHAVADTLPAKGQSDRLTIVALPESPLPVTLIDTPDIDGELPEHHAVADRVFRWADGVLLVVSPEKYQMPELQPYYRLAERYGMAVRFVMNKADDAAVVADYRSVLARSGYGDAVVFAAARDDATWQPPADGALSAAVLTDIVVRPSDAGVRNRCVDVVSRANDQVLHPALTRRAAVDRVIGHVHALGGDAIDIDVHPLTQQLQRRMREQSVLYLIGPQRMLDRVRTMPTLLARLPRSVWDWTRKGEFKMPGVDDNRVGVAPDFAAVVSEQFQSLQSRIDDLIHGAPQLAAPPAASGAWKIETSQAAAIADEELASLRQWLEARQNKLPRDTAVINKLLSVIPGAGKLGRFSEAAPYLLAITVAAHGAVFGHLDLAILGGYSAFTWLTQRISDEVAGKTRQTNTQIAERYAKLADAQIDRAIAWLNKQAPPARSLEGLRAAIDDLQSAAQAQ